MVDLDAVLTGVERFGLAPYLLLVLVIYPALTAFRYKRFGVFGFIGSWWRRKKREIVERDLAIGLDRVEILEHKIELLNRTILEMEKRERDTTEYTIFLTGVIREWQLKASASNVCLEPPVFLSFTEWKQENKRN